MALANAVTVDGREFNLTDELIESLRSQIRGVVLTPDDADYHDVRQIWNGVHDKHPAMIVRCIGTADVVTAVNFSRENDLLLSVRGGGHNVAGHAMVDGGLAIDLSLMKGISVDPTRRIARVQPGATWADLDQETQLHGLVVPGGQVSTTGVAGLTLSGGMGMIHRKFGLSCDNLSAAEIVTADGQVITASEVEHPDLFWAIRGGGGNFGVVTWFEFHLHPFGPEAVTATTIYPGGHAADILHKWRDYTSSAPDDVTSMVALWSLPPLPDIPPERHGDPIVIVYGVYAGPVDEGQQVLQPLRELAEPIMDMSMVAPWAQIQSAFDVFYPSGGYYYWKSLFLEELTDPLIERMTRQHQERPSVETNLILRHLGGEISRVPEDATAYANRSALYNMSIDGQWSDPAHSNEVIEWVRGAWDELSQLSGGGIYLNFAGFGEESDDLVRAGYRGNMERLRRVKRQYDPDNIFRTNVNIRP